MNKDDQLCVRMTTQLKRRLIAIAEAEEHSAGQLIRKLIFDKYPELKELQLKESQHE